ncbi:acyl-CoA carboxylase subunit epsilon [Agromyces sp. NPDC056965]|uniref:acyl-CoA carboxylase subunit epsilon n=1 Tax=Agromyces sp. NPDC056965 TaxID=3345983 RepID=UPI00363AF554
MSDDIDERAASLRFESRVVTPEDAAAVTAVLIAAIDEQTADEAAVDLGRSAWVRGSGAMRRSFESGPGRWVRSGN